MRICMMAVAQWEQHPRVVQRKASRRGVVLVLMALRSTRDLRKSMFFALQLAVLIQCWGADHYGTAGD